MNEKAGLKFGPALFVESDYSMDKSPASHLQRKIGLGIDHLWLIAALAGFGVIVSLAPQPPNDLWWHLKIGKLIFSTGAIPHTNIFGWTLRADFPYVYGEWLAELLLYLIYRGGGVSLVLFARTCLALIAFGLVGIEAFRMSGSWRISGLVTALACLMTASNLIVRPQNWSWIPFIVFTILLGAFIDGKLRPGWLLICPALMIFWVNVHGSFILGIALFGIYLVGETIRSFLHLEGYRSWKEIGWIGLVGLLTLLAMLVNPQGIGVIRYVIQLMTDQSSQILVAEWRPPDPRDLGSLFFYVSLMIIIGVWAYNRRRPSPSELLSLLAFLWLALSGVRYVIWFGMIAMPILARSMKEFIHGKSWSAAPARSLMNLVIAVVFFVPAAFLQPWWIEHISLPDVYWSRVWKAIPDGPMLSVQTPVQAVQYLKQHPGGKIFNEMGYGSYLIWALPEQGVFIDPRVELYPYDLWLDYIRISSGVNYEALLEKYGVDRLLLDVDTQSELIDSIEIDPVWKREYTDPYTQIWHKVSKE